MVPFTFDEAKALVEGEDLHALFRDDDEEARWRYRKLAAVLHPDRSIEPDAAILFSKLTTLWGQHNGISTNSPLVVTTKKRSYRLDGEAARGDIATLFHGQNLTDDEPVIVKMCRSPKDADLMAREAKALTALGTMTNFITPDGSTVDLTPFFPQSVETFRHRDVATGITRHANVLEPLWDFVDLESVVKANGGPLHPKDAAWIFRRLLKAIGIAHRAGVIHGAIVPSNVMILPEDHGLVLIDWCYSNLIATPGHIPAAVPTYHAMSRWYPPEVVDRAPATPGTDIYMAGRLLEWMMQPEGPTETRMFGAFIKGTCLDKAAARPQDAWGLSLEFDDLIERLWGRKRFHPFTTPARVIAPRVDINV